MPLPAAVLCRLNRVPLVMLGALLVLTATWLLVLALGQGPPRVPAAARAAAGAAQGSGAGLQRKDLAWTADGTDLMSGEGAAPLLNTAAEPEPTIQELPPFANPFADVPPEPEALPVAEPTDASYDAAFTPEQGAFTFEGAGAGEPYFDASAEQQMAFPGEVVAPPGSQPGSGGAGAGVPEPEGLEGAAAAVAPAVVEAPQGVANLTEEVRPAPGFEVPQWAQASANSWGSIPALGAGEAGEAEPTSVPTTTTTTRTRTTTSTTRTTTSTRSTTRSTTHASLARKGAPRPSLHGGKSADGSASHKVSRVVAERAALKKITLFCWAVTIDRGYEIGLINSQIDKKVGIFACDRYVVLSNSTFSMNGHITTQNIGDLRCEYGGPYYLALNSEIFVRAWKQIFRDGNYRKAQWTVKADPDAVFLPNRLRQQLLGSDGRASVYLNNCDQGLHGPLEVISLGGMRAFESGMQSCVDHLSHEFTWAGEDVFLRHCLGLLKVNRVDNFRLLSEDHCFFENPAKDGCWSGKVAFHPFKTTAGFYKCLWEAEHTKIVQ